MADLKAAKAELEKLISTDSGRGKHYTIIDAVRKAFCAYHDEEQPKEKPTLEVGCEVRAGSMHSGTVTAIMQGNNARFVFLQPRCDDWWAVYKEKEVTVTKAAVPEVGDSVQLLHVADGESAGILCAVHRSALPKYYIYMPQGGGIWYRRKDFRITHKADKE